MKILKYILVDVIVRLPHPRSGDSQEPDSHIIYGTSF